MGFIFELEGIGDLNSERRSCFDKGEGSELIIGSIGGLDLKRLKNTFFFLELIYFLGIRGMLVESEQFIGFRYQGSEGYVLGWCRVYGCVR